jgi:hypothetical protein
MSAAGNVLTVSDGTWTGSPTSFAYQWFRCNPGCTEIAGETANTYTTREADLGRKLAAAVTATNASGSGSWTAYSWWQIGGPEVVDYAWPRITGDTTTVGSELTVSTGTWTGATSYTYQWYRCDVNNCAAIDGATAVTYTVHEADLGDYLSAVVTAHNAIGTGSWTATTPVVGAPIVAGDGWPSIGGDTTTVGSTLTIDVGTWHGSPTSYTYLWRRCAADYGDCIPIAGATGPTYTTQDADLGHRLAATVTAANAYGSTSEWAWALTAIGAPTIADGNYPQINGDTSAAGATLTATAGTWTGSPTSITFQWHRCDAQGCEPIEGATAATYTTQASDLGRSIEAAVTATNAYGSTTDWAGTSIIGAPTIANGHNPQVSGDTLHAGSALTLTTTGEWTGSPTSVTVAWLRCDADGWPCETIAEGADSYTTVEADLGHLIEAAVTATNVYGSTTRWASAGVIGAPRISGGNYPWVEGDTTDVGSTLTAHDGTWDGSPTLTHQWERCNASGSSQSCTPIAGATAGTYTIVNADVGHALRLDVTATNAYAARTIWSITATIGNPAIAGQQYPWIDGDSTAVGNTLTVDTGTWNGSPTSYAYQWQRCAPDYSACTPIAGATSNTYVLQPADLGALVDVTVTATNAFGSTTVWAWGAVRVGAPRIVHGYAPWITGDTSTVGATLTVSDGTWAGSPTSFTYEWQRCDADGNVCAPIAGATARTYVLVEADVGHRLAAAVTATNAVGSTTVWSYVTALVGAPAIRSDGYPQVHGDATAPGAALTVDDGSWSGSPTSFSYQWQRCDADGSDCVPIPGATASSYTVLDADLGHRLCAVVTATNAVGSATAWAWLHWAVGAPQIVGGDYPSISRAGSTLTVSDGTWSGSPTLTYQWFVCDDFSVACDWTEIPGATSSTYTVAPGDVGRWLLAVVTATNAFGSSSSSAAIHIVPPHRLTVAMAGSGSGTVTSDPAGIDCGSTCAASFDAGSHVTLTATAAAGSVFTGWSGGGCSGVGPCVVTLGADITVTATFSPAVNPPIITSFTPDHGGIHATVTLTGTHLDETKRVTLAGVGAAFNIVSATQLTFTVPPGAATGYIQVTTAGGVATSAMQFTVLQPPSIVSFSPGSGPVGTLVTITGTNLGTTVGIRLGTVLTVPVSVSDEQVTFAVPLGAATGRITVLTLAGSVTSATDFSVTS